MQVSAESGGSAKKSSSKKSAKVKKPSVVAKKPVIKASPYKKSRESMSYSGYKKVTSKAKKSSPKINPGPKSYKKPTHNQGKGQADLRKYDEKQAAKEAAKKHNQGKGWADLKKYDEKQAKKS
ncbi:TPA: hypothetical protein REU56_002932, partial [Listeria monocytogenes]|nr:hypothetical protein [Listeria monocytogenes]